jgi:hypothetical protein
MAALKAAKRVAMLVVTKAVLKVNERAAVTVGERARVKAARMDL